MTYLDRNTWITIGSKLNAKSHLTHFFSLFPSKKYQNIVVLLMFKSVIRKEHLDQMDSENIFKIGSGVPRSEVVAV